MTRALTAALLLLAMPALADQSTTPIPLLSTSRASGTIATGGTAQNIAWTLGNGAKLRCVQNPVAATESLFLDWTGAASTATGVSIELSAGTPFCMGGMGIVTGAWSVNAATAGHAYGAWEAE